MSSIEQSAQAGFVKAADYDRWRPSYPEDAIDALLENLGVKNKPGAKVLDLAAGTGIATSILAARSEGFHIIAIEPHDDMRSVLEAKNLARVRVLKGTADAMPLVEDNWADAVVIAQAFHWFANMEALREIHRVLKPAGVLGMIWNREDYGTSLNKETKTGWERKLKELVWSRGNTEPRERHAKSLEIFEQQVKSTPISSIDPLFTMPLGEYITNWTDWLSKDQICNRFVTISHIAALPAGEVEDIKRLVYQALDADGELNSKGEVAVHGFTDVIFTTAIPSEPVKSID